MTRYEDFVVDRPYSPTSEEIKEIALLESQTLTSEMWNTNKGAIQDYKDQVRDYMFEKQNRRCAYCRMPLSSACTYLHREHIVPKSIHPQWMFEPRNLCVACEVCNINKGDTEVLSDPSMDTFPSSSSDFKIVNPFIDRFSDHILLKGGIACIGITEKGIFTIKTCKLGRVALAEERAKLKYGCLGTVVSKIVAILDSSEPLSGAVSDIKNEVRGIVEAYLRSGI